VNDSEESRESVFLNETRLLRGPWQALERDVARLFVQNNFADVRIVGGTGDHGADILAVLNGKLWVVQCKFTTGAPPSLSAVDEVINAGQFYGADKLLIATSRPASEPLRDIVKRHRASGLDIELAEPARLLKWARKSPEYSLRAKTPYEYQEEVIEAMRGALLDSGKAQIVLATGLGKTVVMAETVSRLFRDGKIPGGKVIVLAHTLPLVDQLIQAFWSQLPRWVATHRLTGQEIPTYWDGITFATVQSVIGRVRTLPDFGLVLVDEAHHVGASTFQEVIETLAAPMLGGVTATPWRGDGYDIDTLLGPPVAKIGISEGLAKGFLSRVDYRLLGDNLDWEFVQAASANRYSLTQLNKRLIIPTRDEEAARLSTQTFVEEKRRAAIVYCPSAIHAREFAAMLRQYGHTAEAILNETGPRERDRLFSRFRAGALRFVTTVDLFNEGVDVPDVDMIVFMRATHSRRIFVQQLGRGLRISEGKDRVIVLDFVTDLLRIAEVVDLDQATRGGSIERLGLGSQLITFSDHSAGSFLQEWMLDQASLILREGDPKLELPRFNFPTTIPPGGVQ
jgi:superfamily II DNA or RNA helicase